jgi:hypothetical protein
MNPYSAAKHDRDLLELSILSSNTMRDLSEVMLAPVVYLLGIGGGKRSQVCQNLYTQPPEAVKPALRC